MSSDYITPACACAYARGAHAHGHGICLRDRYPYALLIHDMYTCWSWVAAEPCPRNIRGPSLDGHVHALQLQLCVAHASTFRAFADLSRRADPSFTHHNGLCSGQIGLQPSPLFVTLFIAIKQPRYLVSRLIKILICTYTHARQYFCYIAQQRHIHSNTFFVLRLAIAPFDLIASSTRWKYIIHVPQLQGAWMLQRTKTH